MRTVFARGLLLLALALWPVSVFVSWISATGMAFGMAWRDYNAWQQLFFLAPFVVLPIAGIVWAVRRRSLEPGLALLVAPLYQALHIGAALLFNRT